MSDNNNPVTTKLKNPTRYHLLATQQRQQQQGYLHDSIDPLALSEHLDPLDCYPSSQQFISPVSNSPLQDYDDMMIDHPSLQRQFFSNNHSTMFDFVDESPSDYSSSVDLFMHHHLRNNSISSQYDPLYDHPLSAPTNYDFMNMVAFQPSSSSRSLEEYESIQLNHQLLSEKKRRRRESHNAVERRRRENINERIQELGKMLPEAMFEELITVNANGNNNKPNKGAILGKSVDHIKILQQEVSTHKQRIHDLERQLAELSA